MRKYKCKIKKQNFEKIKHFYNKNQVRSCLLELCLYSLEREDKIAIIATFKRKTDMILETISEHYQKTLDYLIV